MRKHKGITWRTFLVAVALIILISVVVTAVIGRRSVSVVKSELRNSNFVRLEEVEKNLLDILDEVDGLAVGIGVSPDVKLFFNSQLPDMIIDGFYLRMKNMLKSYAFSMRDVAASFMLYSPEHNHFVSDDISTPYTPNGTDSDLTNNAEWMEDLERLQGERSRISYRIRASNNSYPYVLTLIHQMMNDSHEGVVAVDIDLKKLYSQICTDTDDRISAWVLDQYGRVIVTKNKTCLFQSASEFELLSSFEKTTVDQSILLDIDGETVAYAQKWIPEMECYIVVTTQYENMGNRMTAETTGTVLVGFVCAVAVIALVYVYTYYSSSPMRRILEMVRDPEQIQAYHEDDDPSVKETADYIVSYMQANNQLEAELEKRLATLRDTKLQALKAQINPHFLFNTLNVIMMLQEDEASGSTAAQVTMNLSDVLRFSLADEHLVLLSDELENAKKYVEILEVRYGGKFSAVYEIDESLLTVKVPRLILQPIIENAVFHGLSAKESGKCELLIQCKKVEEASGEGQQSMVCVEITDNGAGMTAEKVEALMNSLNDEKISMNHIGVQNIARRLRLLYPKDGKLSIRSTLGEGTTVSLTFPYVFHKN